jgi:DNA invertase Pin-like site-specific DNA recombinase
MPRVTIVNVPKVNSYLRNHTWPETTKHFGICRATLVNAGCKKPTPPTQEELNEYLKSHTWQETADYYGYSMSSLKTRRCKKAPVSDINKVVTAYRECNNKALICREYNITRYTLNKVLESQITC